MTAYIFDKRGLTLLCGIVCGEKAWLPQNMIGDLSGDNYMDTAIKLEKAGYLRLHENGEVSVERTAAFLAKCICGTDDIKQENGGQRYIYRCEKLIVVLEADRLSDLKCRIVPLRNEAELEQYLSEHSVLNGSKEIMEEEV